jgi:hypothetical protein
MRKPDEYVVQVEIPLRNHKRELVGHTFIAFTAKKLPICLDAAHGYREHLERQGLGGRILTPTGEVVEAWERANVVPS